MRMDRREFVGVTLGATAGMAQSLNAASNKAKPDTMGSDMKLGLYSITFLGIWYRGEALTLEEMIKRAKKYGYAGVEIDGKRPHGNPLDMPKSRCRELRSMADGEGIDSMAWRRIMTSAAPFLSIGNARFFTPVSWFAWRPTWGRRPRGFSWPGRESPRKTESPPTGLAAPRWRRSAGASGSTDLGLVPRRIDGMRALCGRSRRHPGAAKP